MAAAGVQVERPIVPLSILVDEEARNSHDGNASPVHVELHDLHSNELGVVHARYVIGADGKSTRRGPS
jgi:phenol 2-monooxygenase